ncbi:MAG: hypothetical protein LWW93_09960 [Hyphomicrobiales bacterium]|nr:hypothetical protein [Hyphomicrobiales bacterium]
MIAKTRIVEHLGETALLWPSRIRAALAANDRAKLRMSALQAALGHALAPAAAPLDLGREAHDVAVAAEAVRVLVRDAAADEADGLRAPGLALWLDGLADDVAAMVETVADVEADPDTPWRHRWRDLRPILAAPQDRIARAAIPAITAASKGADSVHRLVMDLHKALNRLAVAHADEIVDGAHCSGLDGDDRRAVAAFMRGLAETRELKFDHPGLDTTAARAGDRLLLQNDIGTTDAHVLCVVVTADEVTLTYTDVHKPRAAFFVSLFEGLSKVDWSKTAAEKVEGLAEGEAFHLVTARLAPADADERDAFLQAIGAALVFLIDWNKARKQLQRFVAKPDAIAILRRAARDRKGHRAFLEFGGGGLVDGAIQRTAGGHIPYGVRLDQALGRAEAIGFLDRVLAVCADARLAGRADRLVRDAVDAELVGRLERSGSSLLQRIVLQAGLARSIAAGLDEALRDRAPDRAAEKAAAATAKRIEEKADRLALEIRAIVERWGLRDDVRPLADAMEQAIDELEEAAFFVSVLPPARPGDEVDGHLARLCATAVRSAEAAARMADAAASIPDGHRVDVDDALAALADLFALEHDADDEERAIIAAVLAAGASPERIFAVVECARRVERATDLFARAGHLMRGHVLGDLSQRGREAVRP